MNTVELINNGAVEFLHQDLNIGFIIVNDKFEVLYHNNVASEMLVEELEGKVVWDFLCRPKDVIELKDLLAKNTSNNFYYETVNQFYVPIEIRVIKKTNPDKSVNYFLYVNDNIHTLRTRRDWLKKTLTVEHFSRSRKIRDGKLDEAIYEILELASKATNVGRVNAWTFDSNFSEIQCIGNFDAKQNKMVPQSNLPRIAMPKYFGLFETEKIILINDVDLEDKASELTDFYLKPNNICALMDIPIRIEGEMIGVVCFENLDNPRSWSIQDQKFGLVTSQMISLAMESYEKKVTKKNLEKTLAEQKILLNEIHHRVKNNLSIIASLMNLQSSKTKDEFHNALFIESKNRIQSIATVHNLLYKSKSLSEINFKDYVNEIIANLTQSFSNPNKKIEIKTGINEIYLEISKAVPFALIINELITNCYKHAFNNAKTGLIEIALLENNNTVFFTIKDNGSGFDISKIKTDSFGIELIHGLIEQLDATLTHENKNGSSFKITFKK